jgi:hypothetical protein
LLRRPVYAIRLTDPTVDDELKEEHMLVTGLHSGAESSATNTLFELCEWLLKSREALASEIIQRQVVVMMHLTHLSATRQQLRVFGNIRTTRGLTSTASGRPSLAPPTPSPCPRPSWSRG